MAELGQWLRQCLRHTRLIFLGLILLLLQYALWFGWGNWIQVWHLRRGLVQQDAVIMQKENRNNTVLASVRSLENTKELLEEKAREELGLVDPSEVYYDVYFKKPVASDAYQHMLVHNNHFL